MPQSLVRMIGHIIFSTKNREPVLTPEVRPLLFAYMAGVLNKTECPAILIGGHIDHIHALCLVNKNFAIKNILEEMKTTSSKWIKTQGAEFREFHWQNGYGAFSVSASNIEKVKRYIQNQEDHHRKKTFQEEFREFLNRYGIEYDESYVWD